MRTQSTSPTVRKYSRDSLLYERHLSSAGSIAAVALLLITLAISFAPNGSGDSVKRDTLASSEFSSGMPLP